jgi:sugar/nucleoside kinase (ribokinase family)
MTDLLIAGGLTIDRFADGSTAPGGSVIHAGRAASAEGVRPTFVTVAGDEPEAREGLAILAAIGSVDHRRADATTRYAHQDVHGRRVLVYEGTGGSIALEAVGPVGAIEAALLAPIADELPAAAVLALIDSVRPRLTVLLVQGWLRRLGIGEPARPLALGEIPDATWEAFAAADAIVVSTEDLAESPEDPFVEAAALRERLGPRPLLVLTLGAQGYLLDDPGADRVVASVPRRVVAGVPTVGAGDTFGAALAIHLGRGASPQVAAAAATERVIRVLESRRA